MALYFSQEGYAAVQNLRNNRDWMEFWEALQDSAGRQMNAALEVPSDQRADATGYARALRDLVIVIELTLNPSTPRSYKPPVKARASGTALNG